MLHLSLEIPGDAVQWANLVVGAVIGFLGSRATAWSDRAIQRRKVARNLMQETRRIRDELGPDPEHVTLRGDQEVFAEPAVHPWMQALVPEAALLRGDVVGDFMRLDRELHNLEIVRGWYVRAVKDVEVMAGVYGKESAKHQDARDNAAEMGQEFARARAKVTGLLERIEEQLEPYASPRPIGLLRRKKP